MAFAVALPIALISLAKLLLLLGTLLLIAGRGMAREADESHLSNTTSPVIFLALAAITASGLWQSGASDAALTAIAKHGKLILIPILLYLIRSFREARLALVFFLAGQLFLLSCTVLLALGVTIPWAKNLPDTGTYAIFSTYLDQSIMTAVLAAVCWHHRSCLPPSYRTPLAMIITGTALASVFFLFQGRTGHLVAIAMMTLGLVWALPRHLRRGAILAPVVLLVALASSSSKVRNGLMEIDGSIGAFAKSGDISTSSGTRLNLWHRSLQSIAENPWSGSGAGSWNHEFNRLEARYAPATFSPITGNPHQEYLLWGVELGVPGIALLCAILLAVYRDSVQFAAPARHALQSVLVALAIAALFNCALYDALIGDFFCVTLAIMLALGRHARPVAPATASLQPVTG